MINNPRIGIIDIGSNSIRMALYEKSENSAYRIINEVKESARLSERINANGKLEMTHILFVANVLNRFKRLYEASGAKQLYTVATAAIRNAANSRQIVDVLKEQTGLDINVLSGEEEARLGFLGMINSMDVKDGFLIDIGGGSTEITLFLNRELVHSVSLPFGCVNTAKQFGKNGDLSEKGLVALRQMILSQLERYPWIRSHSGLPLIGVGGTIRNTGKISQRRKKYSLRLAHHYEMDDTEVNFLLNWLLSLPMEERKNVDGLSGDRADILLPGMVILQTIFRQSECTQYVVCGSGLRDGLFYQTQFPDKFAWKDVLRHSVNNLLLLHPTVPLHHVRHVNRLALKLFDELHRSLYIEPQSRLYIEIGSLLYRIGISINYYDFRQHTFYLIAHSRINGLNHRDILICALVASFQSKSRTRNMLLRHRDILSESDFKEIIKLGTLLNLAIALDRSETQPITEVRANVAKNELTLYCRCRDHAEFEFYQAQAMKKEFKKIWGLKLNIIDVDTTST